MERVLNPLIPALILVVALGFLGGPQKVSAQDNSHAQEGARRSDIANGASIAASGSTSESQTEPTGSSRLVIGPGDEVEITVYGAPDLSEHARVSADGNISMPLIDTVRIGGLTSSEAEGAIEGKLRQNLVLNDPQVSVFVKEYTSSEVSLVGEVVKPGSYSTLGPHRLFDVLQAAGGLTEKAANQAAITHRGSDTPITVELAKDPTKMAQSNIEVQPGDTIVVPAAPIVYVLGEVGKPGGYVLGSGDGVTVLRVVAAAGGPTRDASLNHTTMLRKTPTGLKQMPVPLKNLMHAKVPDMPLEPDDIIFVPNSRFKEILNGGALVTSLGTVALYRVP